MLPSNERVSELESVVEGVTSVDEEGEGEKMEVMERRDIRL